jgi:gas vesicle protein
VRQVAPEHHTQEVKNVERRERQIGSGMEPPINPRTGHHYGHELEQRRRRMWRGFWVSTFLFGAAVGGLLGILFAPRKGSEMRASLVEGMAGQGVSREFQKRVNEALSTGRTTPAALVSQAQRQLDEMRSQAVERLQDARLRARILQKQAELRYLQGRQRARKLM